MNTSITSIAPTKDNNKNNELQEKTQQVLTNIAQLQTQEKSLYANLSDVSLSEDQKQLIINQINEISQIRINMFSNLQNMYEYYQNNAISSKNTLTQSMAAVKIVEQELNRSKQQLKKMNQDKDDKIRLIEINDYFGKRYHAHTAVMKNIVYMCIPIILLSLLVHMDIMPLKLFSLLVAIVIIIWIIIIGKQLIDMSNRDNMNWDVYSWYFNQTQAPAIVPTTTGTGTNKNHTKNAVANTSDPWTAASSTSSTIGACIGPSCCTSGMTFDTTKNVCITNE